MAEVLTAELLLELRARSELPYMDKYLMLYSAYNRWYAQVTHTDIDREALKQLKQRYGIWDEYRQGLTLGSLRHVMGQLADYTQKYPFPSNRRDWTGELNNEYDWQSLIEFWYQVRCRVVHGASVDLLYVRFAYETLAMFMDEVIRRIMDTYIPGDETWEVDIRALLETPL